MGADPRDLPAEAALTMANIKHHTLGSCTQDTLPHLSTSFVNYPTTLTSKLTVRRESVLQLISDKIRLPESVSVNIPGLELITHLLQAYC